MVLDNRATDRQSHAHSARLGGEEGSEQPVGGLRIDTDTGVLNGDDNWLSVMLARLDVS